LEELLVPNYEYECTECAHRFELWQSVGEEAPACPECGSVVRKIFHPIRTIYKGSGFYITDSRSEKSSKSSSGSETKTETTEKADTPKADTPKADTPTATTTSDNSSPAKAAD
jgi:putative FmdB family regulatory protein